MVFLNWFMCVGDEHGRGKRFPFGTDVREPEENTNQTKVISDSRAFKGTDLFWFMSKVLYLLTWSLVKPCYKLGHF